MLNYPDVISVTHLSEAVERSNVNVKSNIIIINEISEIKALQIKSITVNDMESAKVFYVQDYETYESQSLVYGATNNVIRFHTSGQRRDIDKTSIERIHAINLEGQQGDEASYKMTSFLKMVAEQKYYSNITSNNMEQTANAIAWLSFTSYVNNRNINYKPFINLYNYNVLNYRRQLYLANNDLYVFLTRRGIIECEGFIMESKYLKSCAKRGIEEKLSSVIKDMSTFVEMFEFQYGLDLNTGTDIVQDLAPQSLVTHVHNTMETMIHTGYDIDKDAVLEQLRMYESYINKSNATYYFMSRNSIHNNSKDQSYKDIYHLYEPYQ
jgi:hypothetical protein